MVGAKEESKPPAPVITPLPPAPNSAQTHLLLSRFPDPGLLSKPETKPIDYKPTPQDYHQNLYHTAFHSSPLSDPNFASKLQATTQTASSSKLPTVNTSTHFVPSLENSYPSTTMELHDSSGALLPSFSANPDPDQSQQQNVVPNASTPQMLHPPSVHPNAHIHSSTTNTQDIASNGPQDAHNVGDIRTQPIITSTSTANIPPIQSHNGKKLEPIPTTLDSANTHAANEATVAAVAAVNPGMVQSNSTTPPTSASLKKPSRMPGTKQCPSCQSTIAAAVAKCPKCPHVFREKKEKIKRSGKRGKKNCPKCKYENPSACSSCKSCKYVFRLKLMDKYKQLRSRQQQNESEVAAAAAAAHAAANMAHNQHTAVSAVSTVPLPAGVTAYPNHMAHQLHPSQVMPPLSQHPMTLHPHAHNVHATSMPQIHPLPQHTMHQNPTHPQL